ncbi:TonB-dependent receptor plug domain-containing protein [Sphingomonas silueang]|uniref:TonB-dependent receptor plug domain-containing protein n=1 Tax=Sphingomonas silueang TaxID=3156617 RepID=UPI0032B497DD
MAGNTATIACATTADGERVTGAVRVEGAQGSPYYGGAGVAAGVNGINGSRDVTATEGTKSFTSGALTIGSKVPQSIKDVPQSVSVLTSERIQQQGIQDYTQAVRQLPGITVVLGPTALQPIFYSRGFGINTIQFDGGAPLALDGKLRGRLVMTCQDRRYFYDRAKDDKTLVYGIVELDATPITLLTAGVNYSRQNSLPWLSGLPRYLNGGEVELPRSTCLCMPWSRWTFDTTELFGSVEQKLGDDWTAKASLLRRRQRAVVGLSPGQCLREPRRRAQPRHRHAKLRVEHRARYRSVQVHRAALCAAVGPPRLSLVRPLVVRGQFRQHPRQDLLSDHRLGDRRQLVRRAALGDGQRARQMVTHT